VVDAVSIVTSDIHSRNKTPVAIFPIDEDNE